MKWFAWSTMPLLPLHPKLGLLLEVGLLIRFGRQLEDILGHRPVNTLGNTLRDGVRP